MKKVLYLTVGCALALTSCTKFDFDENNTAITKENAENIFGMIDPNQDWRCIDNGSIQVTADAPLKNITKIQILTESPFFNDQAKILAETNASKGDIVNINYEAPRGNERLIAACVDDNGNYFIKGFNITDSKVSFNNSAMTRGVGMTRVTANLPNIDEIELKYSDSFQSFNARRALSDDNSFSNWKGKNWENDRMWLPSGPTSSNGWTMERNTIYSDAPTLSDEDKATLEDIFNSSLYRDDPKGVDGRRDNLPLIREGKAVKFFNNHLVSNGKAAITLSPIQMASTEAYMCDIYYYYYKVADVPTGTTETDYIKSLPKFKAIDLDLERGKFKEQTGIDKNKRDENFLRLHEYVLPYYGEPNEFFNNLKHDLATTDGKVYRIRHGKKDNGKDLYLTYLGTTDNQSPKLAIKEENADKIANQLWQIFDYDGKHILYNIGSQYYLITGNNKGEYTNYSKDQNKLKDNLYDIIEKDGYILIKSDWAYLGSDIGRKSGSYRVALNKPENDGDYIKWYLESYDGKPDNMMANIDFGEIEFIKNAEDLIIPDGYRIGFLIRKDNGQTNGSLTNDKYGCLYGYGELNKEINSFGQFKNAVDKYRMNEDDPRMAMFTANGKIYLCFEEGADTQYSDVILELGGVSTMQVFKESSDQPDNINPQTVIGDENGEGDSGTYLFESIPEDKQKKIAYTMCFEDRPNTADYDLNDVVLRCIRDEDDPEVVQLSILAVGATDLLKLEGIEGELVSGQDLGGKELHEYFEIGPDITGEARFVNTLNGNGSAHPPVSASYRIGTEITISKFLSKIKVKNMSQGQIIGVPLAGDPPYAIIMPGDFDYPREYHGIEKAYATFQIWVQNANMYNSWPDYKNEDDVVKNMFNMP